jgi:hypothetical protein
MKKSNYCRYFSFLKYDTTVNEISTNDFKPFLKPRIMHSVVATTYSLLTKDPLYYGFLSRARAMEMAKAGALEYMEILMEKGTAGKQMLLKYRIDHYDDLNQNLTYAKIEAIKNHTALL